MARRNQFILILIQCSLSLGKTIANLAAATVAAALNVLLIKTSIARIGLTLARFTQPKLISMLSLQVEDSLELHMLQQIKLCLNLEVCIFV